MSFGRQYLAAREPVPDVGAASGFLGTDGTLILVGIPDLPSPLAAFALIFNRGRIADSLIGGIRQVRR